MAHSVTDEVRYRMLRYLEGHPEASQRDLAHHLGVSVGKINYCLRALVDKGLVKMRNFRGSKKKLAYAYIVTAKGLEEKANVTVRFLRRKIEDYDTLAAEIERLHRELAESGGSESKPTHAHLS